MMSNVLIAFFNAWATFLSMVAGESISRFLPAKISGYAGDCINDFPSDRKQSNDP
jgi:hypothetical protein